MRLPVETLSAFYQTPLGQAATAMIARGIAKHWPSVGGLDVLGLGYAVPYLERLTDARCLISAMPATQGAAHWPATCNATVLSEEVLTPFCDAQFDRVLMIHALEDTLDPAALLREVWRITAPEGRVLVVATCRQGLWSAGEHTPFGHGRPYSRGQLNAVLTAALFEPLAATRVLYMPPVPWGVGAVDVWERVGARLWPRLSGVVMIEAVKRLYASSNTQTSARAVPARLVHAGWSRQIGPS